MNTNCKNCGATLAFEFFKDHLTCSFCDTIHIPSFREELGVQVASDARSDVPCPVCKLALAHGKIDKSGLLVCTQCRGLYLHRDELLKIIIYVRRSSDTTDRAPDPINSTDLARELTCPGCARTMDTHSYFGPGDYVIDSCSGCERVWLDGGELSKSSTVRWSGSPWQ